MEQGILCKECNTELTCVATCTICDNMDWQDASKVQPKQSKDGTYPYCVVAFGEGIAPQIAWWDTEEEEWYDTDELGLDYEVDMWRYI